MRIFKGIAASEGLAKGKALVHHHASMAAEKQHILSDGVAGELEKFRTALASAKRLLEEHNTTDIAKDSREILETHMLMLEDPEYIQQIEDYIRTNLVCSQWAVDSVTSNMVNLLEATGDELLRERAVDFRDVSLHLIDAIKGKGERRMEHLDEDVVLIADILMPSEIFSMDKTHILGISLDGGGRASHVAILVRAFNIPTVLATNGASKTVTDGEEVIVDGIYGEVFIRPDHTVSQMLDERFNLWQEHEVELHKMVELPTTTTDGHSMLLKANIQTTSEMEAAKACGASGIGLFRSEFLFMESLENPSEERQFAVYRQVLEAMAPKPVTIRTIDIGGDKMVSGLGIDEKNPILGWRAVRFCLSRKDIFTVQLRALLRASVYGKLQIMFPMISGVEELNAVLHLLEHVKDECRRESIPFDPDVKVGTMIEVASAALCADILAKRLISSPSEPMT
ncbi:MAG: phosphoenolpyruvate--protein phosphotransferase [Sphaerochaeta sp.]